MHGGSHPSIGREEDEARPPYLWVHLPRVSIAAPTEEGMVIKHWKPSVEGAMGSVVFPQACEGGGGMFIKHWKPSVEGVMGSAVFPPRSERRILIHGSGLQNTTKIQGGFVWTHRYQGRSRRHPLDGIGPRPSVEGHEQLVIGMAPRGPPGDRLTLPPGKP